MGRGIAFALLPQTPNEGPTNPWALHLPAHLPRGAPNGRPRGLLPRVRVASCLVGLFTFQPTYHVAPLTDVHVDPFAWPLATCPRHLHLMWATRGSATWPCVPRRICAGPACHVSSVPSQLLATSATGFVDQNTPLFAILIKKIFKNQIKIRKRT